jgi:NitT/TauT family transport system substrate-binding protein
MHDYVEYFVSIGSVFYLRGACGVDADNNKLGDLMRLHVRVFAVALACFCGSAAAELKELVIAQQPGIGYLNLMVMQEKKLIEKHALAAGLGDVKVTWLGISNGGAMNEALNSEKLNIAAGGVAPLIFAWANSQGKQEYKGIASLNTMPLYLNSKNPNVKTVADFTDKDRIAMPAVKTSIQAVTLEMAAASAFGEANWNKLDPITVTMAHPEASKKMLDPDNTDISAHFSSPPFQYQQLKSAGIHTVTTSYDVLNGVSSFNVLWASSKFARENPKLLVAFIQALDEATAFIRSDHDAAAALYLRFSKEKTSPKEVADFLGDPYIEYTLTPKNIWRYSNFMARIGAIKVRPTSWRDLFFANIHDRPGS